MSLLDSIPARIKEVVERHGLSVVGFAELLGVKTQLVRDVLRGKQRVPQSMLASMAMQNMDIDYVLTGQPRTLTESLDDIKVAAEIASEIGGTDEEVSSMHMKIVERLRRVRTQDQKEKQLLNSFRACSEAEQEIIVQTAARFAGHQPPRPATATQSFQNVGSIGTQVTGNIHGGTFDNRVKNQGDES